MKKAKTSSAIRYLKRSASTGDLSALYQLYENYRDGNGIEKDDEAAEDTLKKCAKVLSKEKPKLRLDSIELTDFRRLSKLKIDFDSKLTVLIGNNGTGKTSIAESITKILSWVSAGIEKEGKTAKPITDSDINESSEHFAEIRAEFKLGKDTAYEANLSRTIKGAAEVKLSRLSELSSIADLYRVTNSKHVINLPILAYYSATRSSRDSQQTFQIEKLSYQNESSRFDAYDKALDGGDGSFIGFLEWFLILDNFANHQNQPKSAKLMEEITLLESIEDSQKVSDLLLKKRQELISLKNPAKEHFILQRRTIEEAISSIIPEITKLVVDRSSGRAELKVKMLNKYINITQLSDGQRVITSLAADLSRRLVMLNPKEEKPLTGQGIVIIDEIELHLHPQWQQSILLNLQDTFPNIQFIVTTHSPQVLSVVDKSCIRLLGEDSDNGITVTTPEYQTKGVISSDILEQIMGTFATPQISEATELQDLHTYIAEDNYESKEALDLFQKLKKHFGENHPEITLCHSQIRLQKLKAIARLKSEQNSKNHTK